MGERGRYRLTQPVQAIQVPATVQAILAARIDRLLPEDKRLLQVASVVGKDVPFALLQAIAELPDEALRRGLDHLQVAEFLYETGLYPDLEYSFKHALTHEVTYGGLLQERRRHLHARVVDAIETLHRDRLGEHLERLAHHARHGDLWDKAVTYGRQAGAKAVARSAYVPAVTFFEGALEALEHLPEPAQITVEAIDLRLDLALAFVFIGQLVGNRRLAVLREAEALATTLGDQRRLARILAMIGQWLSMAAEFDVAFDVGTRALDLATALADVSLEVRARAYLAQRYYSVGEYRRAVELFRRDAADHIDSNLYQYATAWLILPLAMLGRFADGMSIGGDPLQLATASDQPTRQHLAYACLGLLYTAKGDIDRAIALLERGAEVSRTWRLMSGWDAMIIGFLGWAYHLAGRHEVLPLLEQAVERQEALGYLAALPDALARLSEGYLLAGRFAEAGECAQRALDLARRQKQRGAEAVVLHCLGTIASSLDTPEQVETAEAHYRQAITLGEPRGMRPLVAHCHLGLAKLYMRTGKLQQAQEHLTTAIAMYREMDMTYWREKAAAEMGGLA